MQPWRRSPIPVLMRILPVVAIAFAATAPTTSLAIDEGCKLPQPAFCDTFKTAYTGGGRSGELDPAKWSVTRQLAGLNWGPSNTELCDKKVGSVVPPFDVKV